MTLPKINAVSANTIWYLFFTGIKTLSTLATVMIVSRNLNTDDFGALNFLLSIFMYSVVFESLAHPQVVKKIYLSGNLPKDFLKNLYLLSLALSLTAFFVLSFTGWLVVERQFLIPFFLLIGGLAFKAFLPLSYIYDAHLKSKISTFSLSASTVLSQTAAVLIVLIKPSLAYLALAYGSQPILQALLLLIFRKHIPIKYTSIAFTLHKDLIYTILKTSFPLFLAALFVQSITRIDALMVKDLLSYEDLGFFSIAVRLTDPWVLLSSAVCISVFPVLMNLYKKSNVLFSKKIFSYNLLLLGIAIVVILPVLGLSGVLIKVLFGPRYADSTGVLNIYIFSIPFLFVHNLQSIWEVIKGYQMLLIYRALVACTTNVALNYFMIPVWGLKGAALATVFSYFMLTMGSSLIHPKLRTFVMIQFNLFKKET